MWSCVCESMPIGAWTMRSVLPPAAPRAGCSAFEAAWLWFPGLPTAALAAWCHNGHMSWYRAHPGRYTLGGCHNRSTVKELSSQHLQKTMAGEPVSNRAQPVSIYLPIVTQIYEYVNDFCIKKPPSWAIFYIFSSIFSSNLSFSVSYIANVGLKR